MEARNGMIQINTTENMLNRLDIYENELRKMRLEIALYRSALTPPKRIRKKPKKCYTKEILEQVSKMNLS